MLCEICEKRESVGTYQNEDNQNVSVCDTCLRFINEGRHHYYLAGMLYELIRQKNKGHKPKQKKIKKIS